VREHAVELATKLALEQHEQLEKDTHVLLPGSSSSLEGLLNEAREYSSDPEEMARILSKHWGDVLSAKPIDRSLLQDWLDDLPDRLSSASESWCLSEQHIQKTISAKKLRLGRAVFFTTPTKKSVEPARFQKRRRSKDCSQRGTDRHLISM